MKNADDVENDVGLVIGFKVNDNGVDVERFAVEKQFEKRIVFPV